MNHNEFSALVDRRYKRSLEVLSRKAREYASANDRFHNFNVAGAAKGETPEQALWGFYMKHWVSVQDMVQSGETPDQAWIDEKMGDSINYLLLLEGLFSTSVAQNVPATAKSTSKPYPDKDKISTQQEIAEKWAVSEKKCIYEEWS